VTRALAQVRPIIREMLAIHEALRKLGFRPEEIFVLVIRLPGQPGDTIGITVRAQGRRCDFPLTRLRPSEAPERLVDEWNETARAIAAGEYRQKDLDDMYASSDVVKNQTKFLLRLLAHGLRWPRSLQ